jgi:hypothetical protein
MLHLLYSYSIPDRAASNNYAALSLVVLITISFYFDNKENSPYRSMAKFKTPRKCLFYSKLFKNIIKYYSYSNDHD